MTEADTACPPPDEARFARAELAWRQACRDLADAADTLAYEPLGDPIIQARRLRTLALRTVDRAVTVRRAGGAGWGPIAEDLGLDEPTARRRYHRYLVAWWADPSQPVGAADALLG